MSLMRWDRAPDDRGRFVVTFAAVFVFMVGASFIVFRVRKPAPVPEMPFIGSQRCSQCSAPWPRVFDKRGNALFQPCPECGGTTSMSATTPPMPMAEAETRRKLAAFEKYYTEEWPAKRADREAKAFVAELDAFESEKAA